MNTKQLIALSAAALFGATAFAQEATYEYPTQMVSGKSRAEVQAEVAQARASGTLFVGGEATPNESKASTATAGTRSRADVRKEAQQAPRRDSYESYNRRG